MHFEPDVRSVGKTLARSNGTTATEARRRALTERSIKQLVGGAGKPDYDSIVVAGNGIGALTFAARIARDPAFAGRVTVVAPAITETRRLINGVSLRGLAADYICAATGCSQPELIAMLGAAENGQPVTFRQTAAMFRREARGWDHSQVGVWQSFAAGEERPVVFGARNSRVTAAISELMAGHGIEFILEQAHDANQLKAFAKGKTPLIVNATNNAALLGSPVSAPKQMVFAAQVPFRAKASGIVFPLEPFTTHTALVRRNGIINVGYFSPFSDPLSPLSAWYGIFARVVDADAGRDKEEELCLLKQELFEVGDALGLIPDDPEHTYGAALVPAAGFGGVAQSADGTLELKRAYSGGAPCFLADGMLSAAMGGVLAAEAVINGKSADAVVRKALKKLRWYNRLWSFETTKMAGFADWMIRTMPRIAIAYPHKASLPTWAAHV